jgi:hypothetical protein
VNRLHFIIHSSFFFILISIISFFKLNHHFFSSIHILIKLLFGKVLRLRITVHLVIAKFVALILLIYVDLLYFRYLFCPFKFRIIAISDVEILILLVFSLFSLSLHVLGIFIGLFLSVPTIYRKSKFLLIVYHLPALLKYELWWFGVCISFLNIDKLLLFFLIIILAFPLFCYFPLHFLIKILNYPVNYPLSYRVPTLYCKIHHFGIGFGIVRPVWWLYCVCYPYRFTETGSCSCLLIIVNSKSARGISEYLCFSRYNFS